MNEIVHIGNSDISVKEYRGQRVVTLKDIDMVHGRPDGTARRNFNTNKSRFIENEDFFVVSADEIRTSMMFPISDKDFMSKVLITEQGYLMLVKSFTDDLAWDVQRQLVNGYFKRTPIASEELSPATKLMLQMANQIAESELKAIEAKKLAEKAIETTESIKEAVKPVIDNWREEMVKKIRRIQNACGSDFQSLNTEIYRELERRAGCDLGKRLRNKQEKMYDRGCTKTSIKNTRKIDCIEEDRKLREIFSKIVSEYEIRYCT